MFVPIGIIPITVAVPPFRKLWNDCSVVCFRPTASNDL